ncbi:hypothetical protein ACJRO7_018106 [Eucalyptus globulus]|uniref:Secreted protein n=1 Tax=Eucalyptus globulus TaxID=34317 RepID=A0ABD3KTP1_EUCGL
MRFGLPVLTQTIIILCSFQSVSHAFSSWYTRWTIPKAAPTRSLVHELREIVNGSWDSWTMPLLEQIIFWYLKFTFTGINSKSQVKNMSELSDDFNIVVKNFMAMAGIHAGIASIPFCGHGLGVQGVTLVDYLIKLRRVTSDHEHLATAGYLKILTDLANYLKGCKFLPKLNNECVFASLENLVLIMRVDTKGNILVWIYPDGTFDPVLPAQENVATGAASSSWTPWVHGFYRRMVRLFKDRPLLLSVH